MCAVGGAILPLGFRTFKPCKFENAVRSTTTFLNFQFETRATVVGNPYFPHTMSDSKLADRFATPNSSKLAQILLDLRGVEGQQGLCNLQPSEVTLWPEAFGVVRRQSRSVLYTSVSYLFRNEFV
jgi:hypothetical protein